MNKKRLLGAFLIITSLIVMLLPAAEADAGTSASTFNIESGKLIKYKGTDRTVTVPNDVKVIGKGAFEDNDTVEKIVLPSSVEMIEGYAFWGCDNLKTVSLGSGLKAVDDFAFTNCDGLEYMTIPKNIRSIGIQAFADCGSLEDITIPPEVIDIRDDAFDGDYLLNIHCETGSYADQYAKKFYERQKDMVVYVDPEAEDSKVEFPEDGVYSGADAVNPEEQENDTVSEPTGEVWGSTTIVDNQAMVFMQNTGLPVQNGQNPNGGNQSDQENSDKNTFVIQETGTISERAHYRDESIVTEVVGNDILKIADFAYARSSLKEIVLPQGLQEIGYAAFYHCDNLSSVSIPESVINVSDKAFAHTAWVKNFYSDTNSDDNANGDFLISGGVLVAYRGSSADVIVPEGVRIIAGGAFEDHSEIKTVVLPESLQNIDEKAFRGCAPETVEYEGKAMNKQLIEQRVTLNALSSGAEQSKLNSSVIWGIAVLMLVSGSIILIKKA